MSVCKEVEIPNDQVIEGVPNGALLAIGLGGVGAIALNRRRK